jgi:hypothetical protein
MIPEVFLQRIPELDDLFVPDWWCDTHIPEQQRLEYLNYLQNEYKDCHDEDIEPPN